MKRNFRPPAKVLTQPEPDRRTLPLGDVVAAMAGPSPIDRAAPVVGVRRDMRCEPELADIGSEAGGVMALVPSDGATPSPAWKPGHTSAAAARSAKRRLTQFHVDQQGVACSINK
jgi:hypothetical protein